MSFTFPNIEPLDRTMFSKSKFLELKDKIIQMAKDAYRKHEEEIVAFYNQYIRTEDTPVQKILEKDNVMRSIERDILLKVIDDKWIDHLHCIDALRDGIGLRAYGQKDPLIEYKNEAFTLFNKMMHEIQSETVIFIFRTKFELQVNNLIENGEVETPLSQSSKGFSLTEEVKELDFSKVGRNDPCPCGSGLKYKKCCGAKK